MKTTAFLLALVLLLPVAAYGEGKLLAKFAWPELVKSGQLHVGKVVREPGGEPALRVENTSAKPLQATLLVIEKPEISTELYLISGEVRYEKVEGEGALEMWSHFGEDAAYFTRTMAEAGPMKKLTGDSPWRPFSLPFDSHGAGSHPTKLVVNLVLPGKGVVLLRNLQLTQGTTLSAIVPGQNAWWSWQTAGYMGGIGGAVLGCLGTLLEWLAARGRARGFVVAASRVLIAIGGVAVAAGLIGLLARQPYAVWYVLLLFGVLAVTIFPVRLRRYQAAFRDLELRRIHSLDAGTRSR